MWRRIRRLCELQYFWGEYVTDMLIPEKGPGRFWRLLFRSPVVLYKCGLHCVVSQHVLLLTTTGRKTGELRTTPVGYTLDPTTNTYYIVAGWKGKSNWYRNALTNPAVRAIVGKSRFDALAAPVDETVVAKLLAEYARRNPFAGRLLLKLTGIVSDGTYETFLKMAPFYPTLAVRRTDQKFQNGSGLLGA
jgi:deazaflavin-dependent oxidoreductase (nitroreductase family)